MTKSFGKFLFVCSFILALFFISSQAQAQKKIHTVFFEGTESELHVFRISGHEPGKTILLIGGIQGDEPGGFLSADHYADISLSKGNLIVVPRANFQSIVQNKRQINEDMNRKFSDSTAPGYEKRIVSILKDLIKESDCVLNLHDGSGFYADAWVNDMRNPKRYGQSIIADCDTCNIPGHEKNFKLGDMARTVVKKMNQQIKDPDQFFRFNNHRTQAKDTIHAEQRKSATYYALYSCGIPAFGIESSKSLPLELKVRHHNLAINAFMELFDIIPESPGLNLEKPSLKYLVLSVNDSLPIAVRNQQTLSVAPGDKVTLIHVEANYERGLSADIIGTKHINDLHKTVAINEPTRIVVRKDYYPCGSVYLTLGARNGDFSKAQPLSFAGNGGGHYLFFKIKINGDIKWFANFSEVILNKGDTIELIDIATGLADPSDLVVNFKGFVGDRSNNTGEDRGYRINTAKDLWARYSSDGKGRQFPVIVSRDDSEIGRMTVTLLNPELSYIVFENGQDNQIAVENKGTWWVDLNHPATLLHFDTTLNRSKDISFYITDATGASRLPVFPNQAFDTAPLQSMLVKGPVFLRVQQHDQEFGKIDIKQMKE